MNHEATHIAGLEQAMVRSVVVVHYFLSGALKELPMLVIKEYDSDPK